LVFSLQCPFLPAILSSQLLSNLAVGLIYPCLSALTSQMYREKAGAAQAVRKFVSILIVSGIDFLVGR